jgi:hypothetical protein
VSRVYLPIHVCGDTHQCNVCGLWKSNNEFSKGHAKGRNCGLDGRCKACKAEANRQRREAMTPEQRSAETRKANLWRNFRMTPEEYDQKLVSQGGVCAICGSAPGLRSLCVDHDHVTGENRDLLCYPCNALIGMCGEQEIVLRSAIAYLNKWSGNGDSTLL